MKAVALPLLASHPVSFIAKQIDEIKLVAIQANTGNLAIVADTYVYWTQHWSGGGGAGLWTPSQVPLH